MWYFIIIVLNLTLATRWKCQASVGRLDYGWHCDFCQDWEVKWSWIYRPHAVSALTMAVLRDCCCHRINQWRRDVTPVYIWTVSCELWAVNHLYIPCNCEPCAVSCEFETTINCGPVNYPPSKERHHRRDWQSLKGIKNMSFRGKRKEKWLKLMTFDW